MQKGCTIYRTLDFIGKRWTILILLELYKGKPKWKRYSELKKKMPDITSKVLSARLKELVKEGLVRKKVDASKFPVKSEYSLTRSGLDFIRVTRDIKKWALKWKFKNHECERKDCRECEL